MVYTLRFGFRKRPRQEDSILAPAPDFEDWLIGQRSQKKAILQSIAFFYFGMLLVLGAARFEADKARDTCPVSFSKAVA